MKKSDHRLSRKKRIRANLAGTSERPRLTVYRSLTQITAQVIDDTAHRTIVGVSTKHVKGKSNVAGAKDLGALLAKKAKEQGITAVVFDRNGYKYHGCIKAVADAAREGGLQF